MSGYAIAGTWLLVCAVICSAPAAIAWCLATKRGRRSAARSRSSVTPAEMQPFEEALRQVPVIDFEGEL